MPQERVSLSLSTAARRRAKAMGRRAGSVSAYVEQLIREDEQRDRLRHFIDEHFSGIEAGRARERAVRRELGMEE